MAPSTNLGSIWRFPLADKLSPEDKAEFAPVRGFQVNRDNLMNRWNRYSELFGWYQQSGADSVIRTWGARDWRDLQLLSQLAWMDEEYLATDVEVNHGCRT